MEWPSYGSRRITRELWRQGRRVNRKRVQRLMREDNFLCLRKRRFVATTDSAHGQAVYPNLAREMTLTGIDRLWIADITYIRLETAFIYLAVILDAYSRKRAPSGHGWALDRTLEARLAVETLQMAFRKRMPVSLLLALPSRAAISPNQFPKGVRMGIFCRCDLLSLYFAMVYR